MCLVFRRVPVRSSPYPLLVLSRVRSPKLATPLTAATVVVPPKVLPPGLLPSATVTGPVKLGTTLLAASRALTCTAGLIAAPATVVDGCTVNTSWVAVPGVTSKAVLVTGANPLALAANVYPVPVLFRLRSENVATPPTAATGVVRSEERRVGKEWSSRLTPHE